ncbi:MAG: AAA family ATPase, partial [Spirochaetales bacterium]|nr:AAA family ATPase [Spirochaetales bacterium]
NVINLDTLSIFITEFVRKVDLDVVILIDEVDKSSNNQLFLSFLAMLRDKYLERNDGEDFTFKSVILAGVHDVKSLKLKLREGDEVKINSPWNIAADFNVDMNFNPSEIKTMLTSYAKDKDVQMDFDALAERIHYYTNGYPFLVSKLCKNIDEEESGQNKNYNPKHWTLNDIDWSFRWLTRENYTTTNFDDLVKNLENNSDLFSLVNSILFDGADKSVSFSVKNPIVNLGLLYGMFKGTNGRTVIHNRIYEQILSDYMRSKDETSLINRGMSGYDLGYDLEGTLDISRVLLKFQEFMRENYSRQDADFLEREGRLVFMSFLKPIVNGKGFMWKEPVVADERRMDIVVTFGKKQKEVIELKIWRGEQYHQKGLQQLSDYLDFQGIKTGYLLIFDFNKNKEYRSEQISFAGKDIFAVYV